MVIQTETPAESEWLRSTLGITRYDLEQMENRIMSKLGEFVARQNERLSAIGSSVDALGTSITGIAGDVTHLKSTIERLQNSPGEITPEDQALMDNLESLTASAAERLNAAKAALVALDEATTTSEG